MKKGSKRIDAAVTKLHGKVYSALKQFTTTTGAIVSGIEWAVLEKSDEKGRIFSVHYCDAKSTLRSGFGGAA